MMSSPDSAANSAELVFLWFEAICKFVSATDVMETARPEKISTKAKDIISAAPRRLRTKSLIDFVFFHIELPPKYQNTGFYLCPVKV